MGSLKDIVAVRTSKGATKEGTSKHIIKIDTLKDVVKNMRHIAMLGVLTSLPVRPWICEYYVRYLDFFVEKLEILFHGYMELGLLMKTESTSPE